MKVEQHTTIVQAGMVMEGERAGQPNYQRTSSITIDLSMAEASMLLMDLIDLDPARMTVKGNELRSKLSALMKKDKELSK